MTEYPYMDEGLKRWIILTASRNYWRIPSWYDLEDLIQDGYVCYTKCTSTYPGLSRKRQPTKENRKVFMTLVKRTFENHITDLSIKKTRQKERAVSQIHHIADTADAWFERHGPIQDSVADLSYLIDHAPDDIKECLKFLTTDAYAGAAFLKTKLGRFHIRETTHEREARLAREAKYKHIEATLNFNRAPDQKLVDMLDRVRQYFLVTASR